MSPKQRYILGAVAVFAITAGTWLLKPKPQPSIFLTEEAKKGNITASVVTTGTVRSNNRVEVGAQVSGKITVLAVSLGDRVTEGQLIARIDSSTKEDDLRKAESQLATYLAEYESKKIALQVAQRNHVRKSKLLEVNAASREDVDTASDSLASAKATLHEVKENIKQSEISVRSAKTELGYTTIVSPIDGIVISVPVSVGQTLNSSMETPTIVQIADLHTMLVKLEIPEGDVTKVQPGMRAVFSTLAEPDIDYEEPVKTVDPALTTLTDNSYTESVTNTDAVYYYANVVVPNDNGKLRIGMTTEGSIEIAHRENVVIVPTLAVKREQGQQVVSILTGNNHRERREVEIGISNEFMTEIVKGVAPGDRIILSELTPGEKVGNAIPSPM
ncbi:efflux RND transporter periplasmic adaptor subunit [Klebsiella oxytoca]|uniref:efflux RND transporter periplasmic adaptor subunit n=1 Tax=Klebsiella oxytoca TaxID=571 RepID=UPI0035710B14|nr:efflux RND transporter periplasmic adaptor subunit [Klebsiella oxytoca]HCB2157649.1 efflux RND transporter periplasmic adaptor subunit [Klebsiella oxytoca]